MKAGFAAALVALAASAAYAEDTKLGAGVTIKEPTAVTTVIASPKDFVGKTIRIDGVATAVCTHMGCWMAVAPEGDEKGATIRL